MGSGGSSNGSSPFFEKRTISPTEAWISLVTLTLLYGGLAVVEVGLILRTVKKGADPFEEPPNPTLGGGGTDDEDRPLAFAY